MALYFLRNSGYALAWAVFVAPDVARVLCAGDFELFF
jgi:hypothetical protein